MSYDLKILLLTDIHGNRGAVDIAREYAGDIDVIVVAGDVASTRRGVVEIIGSLAEYAERLLAVPGNCDVPSHFNELGDYNIHGRSVTIGKYTFIGVGGSPPTPFGMPFELPENQLYEVMVKALGSAETENLVVVSHAPPYKTKLDKVFLGLHAGSRALRRFIEEKAPLLCLCGHIHEGRGVDSIGATLLVNPGPARDWYYALITLNGAPEVQLRRWR